MIIGERLKQLREIKNLSQGDIENATGLLRCYISRVENGHTIPAVATLEKMARALKVPTYVLFYDGEKPPAVRVRQKEKAGFGSKGREAKELDRFRRLLGKTRAADQKLLLLMAAKMASGKS